MKLNTELKEILLHTFSSFSGFSNVPLPMMSPEVQGLVQLLSQYRLSSFLPDSPPPSGSAVIQHN